jgi:toxin ParE1/3/4
MAAPKSPAIWSADARADLDEIWKHYERTVSPSVAEKIVRQIDDVIRLIQEHPLAGRARDEVRAGLRSFAATPHVVFYRVRNDVPEIVRVLDGRRDIDEIFASSDS